MSQAFGIDTSILVRLLTGDPEDGYEHCVRALSTLVEDEDAEIFAFNQVIGESYIALQHHYGIAKSDARTALEAVLTSGLVAPGNGATVIGLLREPGGCGLLDRLIANDYSQRAWKTLTLDARMAKLPDASLL